METTLERCCGLDVHQASVVPCFRSRFSSSTGGTAPAPSQIRTRRFPPYGSSAGGVSWSYRAQICLRIRGAGSESLAGPAGAGSALDGGRTARHDRIISSVRWLNLELRDSTGAPLADRAYALTLPEQRSSFSVRATYAPRSASTSSTITKSETIRAWTASSSRRPPTSTGTDRSSVESALAGSYASSTARRPETPRSSFCTLRGSVYRRDRVFLVPNDDQLLPQAEKRTPQLSLSRISQRRDVLLPLIQYQ
jgi:hypothetical protein